jgi:bisanhydrobacterioruberin hydratase
MQKTSTKLLITLAVIFVIVAYFVATQPLTPQLSSISSLSILLFAAPSYIAIWKLLGTKSSTLLLTIMGVYALIIETSAIHTGFPYGNFIYNDILGGKLLGLTPWTVAFAYPPLVFIAYYMTHSLEIRALYRLMLSVLLLVTIDLVLDPAAVALGFWQWAIPGFYYGVPLVNFAGWILSGTIAVLLVHLFFRRSHYMPSAIGISGCAIIWFWAWVNLWLGQLWPFVIGIGLTLLFIHINMRGHEEKRIQQT